MKKYWPEIKRILIIFLIWRVALFVVTIVSNNLLTFKWSFPYIDQQLIPSGFPSWLWEWGNFDGVHYLDIAKHGYHGAGLQAFFPLYPLLIKIFGMLTGNYLFAALLISNLSTLFAGTGLYFLVKKDFSKNIANWAVLFFFSFPTSYYFGAVYTESLFLVLVISSFIFSGIISVILGFAGGLTRLVGALIGPALLIGRKNYKYLICIGGLIVYMFFLNQQFGDPLKFLSGQSAFGNSRSTTLATLVTPPQVMYRYIKIFYTASITHYDFWVAVSEMAFFIFGFIILTISTIKKSFPAGWLVYGWGALMLPTLSGTLSSMPRYVLIIFPIFVFLAKIESKLLRTIILTLFILLLALFTALFNRGYWVA